MTDNENNLRDILSQSELDPNSQVYKEIKLAQTLEIFRNGGKRQAEKDEDTDSVALANLENADLYETIKMNISKDDIDLILSLSEYEDTQNDGQAQEATDDDNERDLSE